MKKIKEWLLNEPWTGKYVLKLYGIITIIYAVIGTVILLWVNMKESFEKTDQIKGEAEKTINEIKEGKYFIIPTEEDD